MQAVKFLIIGVLHTGHVHEHQTDGDLFDNKVKPGVIDISEAAGMQWGPDITKTFGNSEGV